MQNRTGENNALGIGTIFFYQISGIESVENPAEPKHVGDSRGCLVRASLGFQMSVSLGNDLRALEGRRTSGKMGFRRRTEGGV